MKKRKIARLRRRRGVGKLLLQVSAAVVALLVLFLGAGAAYTYYSEPENNASNEQANAEDSDSQSYYEPSLEPGEPAPDASVGVSMQFLTSPVAPGSNATFDVRTLRGAECSIVVEYDEEESTDTGLINKTADRYGMVSWTWTVEETVPEGEWPMEVICSRNEESGMMRANLEVSYDADEADSQEQLQN